MNVKRKMQLTQVSTPVEGTTSHIFTGIFANSSNIDGRFNVVIRGTILSAKATRSSKLVSVAMV